MVNRLQSFLSFSHSVIQPVASIEISIMSDSPLHRKLWIRAAPNLVTIHLHGINGRWCKSLNRGTSVVPVTSCNYNSIGWVLRPLFGAVNSTLFSTQLDNKICRGWQQCTFAQTCERCLTMYILYTGSPFAAAILLLRILLVSVNIIFQRLETAHHSAMFSGRGSGRWCCQLACLAPCSLAHLQNYYTKFFKGITNWL